MDTEINTNTQIDITAGMTADEIKKLEARKTLQERIVHVLTVYPCISPTMLQAGIGPSVKPEMWRPILEDLIAAGIIIREIDARTTPAGRSNVYTKLSLVDIMEHLQKAATTTTATATS